jgi:CheY-like chemotaxis protein
MNEELFEPLSAGPGFGTALYGFQHLERHHIRDVLMVSSLFDFYLFEEEGLLYEQIQSEYHGLQLSHSPEFTRVSSAAEALPLAASRSFDLIITTLHIDDSTPVRLARAIREKGIETPIVLVAYDNRELNELVTHHGTTEFDRVFVWQGDFRLLIAIIKNLEDELNVDEDTERVGVQCIMLVEDSIRYASYFLPLLYSEVMRHSQRLIAEGVNAAHRALRMRARPKILLCSTLDEAMACFERYEQHIIGVISDIALPRGGENDPTAGLDLARRVKSRFFDVPVLLQSTEAWRVHDAGAIGALFLAKNSSTLVDDFRVTLRDHFGFGDFVFFTPDGTEVGRASDLRSLEEQLAVIPGESLLHHGSRNDFSNWLKARTEFGLAMKLRPRRVSDYESAEDLRADLIRHLREHRTSRQRGLVTEFSKELFDPAASFARAGGGSLGGKARGLAFINSLLSEYNVRNRFDGLEIEVPPALVIGTDVFDRFMAENDLRSLAVSGAPDEQIHRGFLSAKRFPGDITADLAAFVSISRRPLAVRSSSLLEDSQFHPFAGVYQTFMIPNNDPDPEVRLRDLIDTIKRVYASTFYHGAREYLKVTSLRFEDEKMAVIIQEMVGAAHGQSFYPDISGVLRSYNLYPTGPQKPEEGIVSMALGLGKTIVEGGVTVRFCPRYPEHLQQFFSPRDAIRNHQHEFYALDLRSGSGDASSILDERVIARPLEDAEEHGTLAAVASTYSAENDALYDGVSRAGTRIVTFAPILRNRSVPLPNALAFLASLGSWGFGTPVEMEFAVNLSVRHGARKKLGIVQMRPLLISHDADDAVLGEVPQAELICQSDQVLGHGAIRDVRDVLVVDASTFDRSRSHDVAREVAAVNDKLIEEGRGYLLVGPGRWGTLDPLLGIPVKWEQICGAKAIIEASFRDMDVDPSQGSHFFQNLTAFQVAYFSVSPRLRNSFVDWEWLGAQQPCEQRQFVRHLRLDEPLLVQVNGRARRGVIRKPRPRT